MALTRKLTNKQVAFFSVNSSKNINSPQNRKEFSQSESFQLHSAWVGVFHRPKCGRLGGAISKCVANVRVHIDKTAKY